MRDDAPKQDSTEAQTIEQNISNLQGFLPLAVENKRSKKPPTFRRRIFEHSLVWQQFSIANQSLDRSQKPHSQITSSALILKTTIERHCAKQLTTFPIALIHVCFASPFGGGAQYPLSKILERRTASLPNARKIEKPSHNYHPSLSHKSSDWN